jgi:hypothetical protein
MQKIAATIRKAKSFVDWRQGKESEKFSICWRVHVPEMDRQHYSG